jgi:hypothetical protein
VLHRGVGTGPLEGGVRRLEISRWSWGYRSPRGTEGTLPGRTSCVCNVTIPLGPGPSCIGAGKPTARKAQLPSRGRMTKKRTPAAERRRESEATMANPLWAVPYNRPDTRRPAWARKGADMVRWACGEAMTDDPVTDGQVGRHSTAVVTDLKATVSTGCRSIGKQ